MTKNIPNRLVFLSVVTYLPFSIFFVFWLYMVQVIYTPDTWQYTFFYGKDGTTALIWLFVDLLPAVVFLLSKSSGKKFITRLFGTIGFYCLLGSLISTQSYLAYPGFLFLILSVIINKRIKKQLRELNS